jgi:hypothetical protein
MIRYQATAFWLVLGCLAGCVDVNGGAVELRWEIRRSEGEGFSCAQAQVARVRLVAAPIGGGTAFTQDWSCNDYGGTTAFDIPPGRYALSIAPVCGSDAGAPPAARVPDPITRDITNGNVAELNTLLIEKLPDAGVICPTQ